MCVTFGAAVVLTAGCADLTPSRPKVRFAFRNAEALPHVRGETGADALRGGASDMCEAPPARTVQLSSESISLRYLSKQDFVGFLLSG